MADRAMHLLPVAALAALLLGTQRLVAQCGWDVVPQRARGVIGQVAVAHTWDRDGAGPQPGVLVVGGSFRAAGDQLTNGLALYDEFADSWAAIGGLSLQDTVQAAVTMPNGDLVVGGTFQSIGGVAVDNIARYDGTSWSPLGNGLTGNLVSALAVLPNGDLVAGGKFQTGAIARWNGTSWSPLGSGLSWPGGQVHVRALEVLSNGDLAVGGWFTVAGSVPAVGVARWDGAAWSAIGGGLNSAAFALRELANGDLVAGGAFGTAGGQPARGLARWDGTRWSGLGGGMQNGALIGVVHCVEELPGGDLLVGGDFTTAGGQPLPRVARWSGATWQPVGAGFDDREVATITTMASGRVVVGGSFHASGGDRIAGLARWSGGSLQRFGDAPDGVVVAIDALPTGEVVVGGTIRAIGGASAQGVALWNGSSWSALGAGVEPERVELVAMLPNGDVVVSGNFLQAGGAFAQRIARWDGSQWSAMGAVINGYPRGFRRLADGRLLAVGEWDWGVRVWDGQAWSVYAGANGLQFQGNRLVRAAVELAGGDLVVGGQFSGVASTAASCIARWDGSSWHPLGSGMTSPSSQPNEVHALAAAPDGSMIAVGAFERAGGVVCNGVARWDGASWSALGNLFTVASQVEVLPNGDVLVYGTMNLPGNPPPRGISRWDGTTWTSVAADVQVARDMVLAQDGKLWVGGLFLGVDGRASPFLGRLDPQCPAPVVDFGGGCSGNTLQVARPAWIGGTCRSRGSGLPAPAIVCVVHGFSRTSLPLVNVVPQALPGCRLLVAPDHVAVDTTVDGRLETSLAIPPAAALVGVDLHQQLVAFAVDGLGNVASVGASNAVGFTVGSL